MQKKNITFENNIVLIGFGTIGKAILPLILRHIDIPAKNIKIITKLDESKNIADDYGVMHYVQPLKHDNFQSILQEHCHPGDFLLNLSVDVSSKALIEYSQTHGLLYLDTCTEPWEGYYTDSTLSPSARSNYAIRDALLAMRQPDKISPTAIVAHGANPGLVSHFVKQALMNIAHDNGLEVIKPHSQAEWAALANSLDIKAIHIAERDTQFSEKAKRPNEFVNTWSIDGFISELSQPAELGWGTHERHWPEDGSHHETGSNCAIYLNRPGATTRVRTWTPLSGPFHAFLITHTESVSIADYFTLKNADGLQYRPTVHFAYHPCEDAVLSLYEFSGKEWKQQPNQRVMFDEIVDGIDELGVLLMGNQKGAYWFGSQLSIHEARELAPFNNATSLQVAVGALSGMIWAMKNPNRGITEPDQMDYDFIMEIAKPYLGTVTGHYTDWTPLADREKLFPENIDRTDPWQFINIRVA